MRCLPINRPCVRILQSSEAVYGLTVQGVLETLVVFRVFQIFLLIFCSIFIISLGLRLVRSPRFSFSFGPTDGKSSITWQMYFDSVIPHYKSIDSLLSTFICVKLLGPLMSKIQLNIILNGTPKPTKSALHLFSAYKRQMSNAVRDTRSAYSENHTKPTNAIWIKCRAS
jgi:hypothetical protein